MKEISTDLTVALTQSKGVEGVRFRVAGSMCSVILVSKRLISYKLRQEVAVKRSNIVASN